MAEGEGQCSTQVEPSPTQDPHDDDHDQDDLPQQEEQVQESASPESPGVNDQSLQGGPESPAAKSGVSGGVGATLHDQDLPEHDDASDDDQGTFDGYDEDDNHGDNQVVTQESLEETQTRREKRAANRLRIRQHILSNVIGDVRRGTSTRRQLAKFSTHHAFISHLEPKKVYEDRKSVV